MNKALTIYKAAVVTAMLGKKTDKDIANKLEDTNPRYIAIVRELHSVIENFWITGNERIEKVEEILRKHKIPFKENWINES